MINDCFPINFGIRLTLDNISSVASELGIKMPPEKAIREIAELCKKPLLSPDDLVDLCGLITVDCRLSDDELIGLYYGLLQAAAVVTRIDDTLKLIGLTRACRSAYRGEIYATGNVVAIGKVARHFL